MLQYSDADYIITHSYTSMSKSEALSTIKRAEKQLKSTEDDAVTQLQELEKAKMILCPVIYPLVTTISR